MLVLSGMSCEAKHPVERDAVSIVTLFEDVVGHVTLLSASSARSWNVQIYVTTLSLLLQSGQSF